MRVFGIGVIERGETVLRAWVIDMGCVRALRLWIALELGNRKGSSSFMTKSGITSTIYRFLTIW